MSEYRFESSVDFKPVPLVTFPWYTVTIQRIFVEWVIFFNRIKNIKQEGGGMKQLSESTLPQQILKPFSFSILPA